MEYSFCTSTYITGSANYIHTGLSLTLTNEQQNILKTISSPSCTLLKINAVSGAGKAQPLSEKILTPDGWKTMADINIGDKVIGSNGKSSLVIGVFPQGIRQIYKVSFIDGTSVL